jgi:putative molybdopterin biosynthesis protein
MIPYEQAKNIIEESLKPVSGHELLDIDDTYGRVNFEDVTADEDVLNFRRCSVDGFAVRSEDVNPGMSEGLKILGYADAGDVLEIKINRGECIGVSTGSVLPKGADMVVMVEDTRTGGDNRIFITQDQHRRNFDEIGSDVKKGEKVLSGGELLDERKIAMLAGVGMKKIKVFRKLNIGIISTGNELVEPGEKAGYGKVYNSNAYMLYSMLCKFCDVKKYPIIEDDYDKIKEIFNKSGEDLLITTGGTSMGEKDVVFKIIEKEGEMLFHKISIKPGKPTFFGRFRGRDSGCDNKFKDKFIMGLPGNPASCFMVMYDLMLPAIKKISRLPADCRKIKMEIDDDFEAGNRSFLVPVNTKGGIALPVFKHSSAVSSIAHADGYIKLDAGTGVKKGDLVEVFLFGEPF